MKYWNQNILTVLQGKMFQFCGKTCCDEYKKRRSVTALCEYCRTEKIIKETVRIAGIDKPFCSEGKKEQGCLREMKLEESCLKIICDTKGNLINQVRKIYFRLRNLELHSHFNAIFQQMNQKCQTHNSLILKDAFVILFFLLLGCKLLYKHDLAKRWGNHCKMCSYCLQTSPKLVQNLFGGRMEEFCSEECMSKFTVLFYQVNNDVISSIIGKC